MNQMITNLLVNLDSFKNRSRDYLNFDKICPPLSLSFLLVYFLGSLKCPQWI